MVRGRVWVCLGLLVWFEVYGRGGAVTLRDSVAFLAATGGVAVVFRTIRFDLHPGNRHILEVMRC